MKQIFLYYSMFFFIYGFLGWIVEVIYTGIKNERFVNRGFLFSPFLPIYAFGAIFLIATLSHFANNILLLYFSGVMATTIIEYMTAVFLENIFHVKWWDYSKMKFNFQGRVCLKNSLLFGILAVIVIKGIQPPIETFVINKLNIDIINEIVISGFLILLVDLYFTLKKLNSLTTRTIGHINKKEPDANLSDLINGKYTDDYITNKALNILLTISVIGGISVIFLIDLTFGMFIMIVFFISFFGVYRQKKKEQST